jgi:hypothetical protein
MGRNAQMVFTQRTDNIILFKLIKQGHAISVYLSKTDNTCPFISFERGDNLKVLVVDFLYQILG